MLFSTKPLLHLKSTTMKKSFITIIFAVAISGCVADTPVKTNESTVPGNDKQVAQRVYDLATKCWARGWGLFHDGVSVENSIELRGTVIKASIFAPDIGKQAPFLEIIVKNNSGKTSVEIYEVPGSTKTPEVKSWLAGNNNCATTK